MNATHRNIKYGVHIRDVNVDVKSWFDKYNVIWHVLCSQFFKYSLVIFNYI